jgi:hypothetical protein
MCICFSEILVLFLLQTSQTVCVQGGYLYNFTDIVAVVLESIVSESELFELV